VTRYANGLTCSMTPRGSVTNAMKWRIYLRSEPIAAAAAINPSAAASRPVVVRVIGFEVLRL
jgi:hypothetical protein